MSTHLQVSGHSLTVCYVSTHFTCRPDVDHVDMSTHAGPLHHQAPGRRASPGTGPGAHVDSVDHLLFSGPHGPHACAGVFWRGRSVDNVGTLDRRLKSAAYNTVYRYCIHFTLFIFFVFILSTLSTKPLFIGAPCGQIMARAMSAILPTWSTKTLLGKVLVK